MRFKPRPGIVKTKICGATVLLPTRQASEFCPVPLRMPLLLTGLWEIVEKGSDLRKAYLLYKLLLNKTDEEAKEVVDKQVRDLCERGYLIPLEDEDDPE